MSGVKSPLDLVRTLADQLFPRRTPGEVIGSANGVMTVAVDGKVRNVDYTGMEDVQPGHKVWLRRIPDDPQDNYSYEGFRLEGGSISGTSSQTQPTISDKSSGGMSGTTVRDGDTNTTFPRRKYLEFQGATVTVIDDPSHDKIIILITAVTPPDYDWDDPTIDWDDPDAAWGG